jgi:hypothetical protein
MAVMYLKSGLSFYACQIRNISREHIREEEETSSGFIVTNLMGRVQEEPRYARHLGCPLPVKMTNCAMET